MTHQHLVVAVVGYTGGVGTCLLSAMKKINLKPFALVRSKTMTMIDDDSTTGVEQTTDYKVLGDRLVEQASKIKNGVPVIADVTASGGVQEHYATWLRQGISVVAANKGIFAGPEATYKDLLLAAASSTASTSGKQQQQQQRLLHETTVGAGLPTLGTLQALKASSHEIHVVQGILSGTLAFVLGQVAGGKSTLSQAVVDAKALGYTEPDPRDDLNGMDVARKAIILARLAGMEGVELDKLTIESLVPEQLQDCGVDEFMDKLSDYDAIMTDRVAKVEASGGRLHYAAKVDVAQNKVEVGLLSCEASHPFNNAGPDNMVAITTNFYTRPLVIQGAGAGGDVTATGVLTDILQCAYQQAP
eukprot:CAMPEP_0119003456 /NCGR_PEP_ID=MMETSP1176-20130426/571_1 /TAXON_ID=265551 /ORGANISM="Synedropsis recta cf, Strain CCMP1620" /LENGTH=358 /DNA_ID=CAMNT_0006955061 /DNA_START=53 /DNA_END=1129 /DNA_ORIENTATION=+